MREERKLENAIQRDGEQSKSKVLEEIKRRYPQYNEQAVNKQTAIKKRRLAVFSTLATVAASLAIILPCALLLPNRNSGGGGSDIYYCSAEEYKVIESEYTLKSYNEKNNGNILFFDWYDTAEERVTSCYVRIEDEKILGMQESAYRPETDEFIELSVTKSNVFLDSLDSIIQSCVYEHNVNDFLVKWRVDVDYANCIFENAGYRYFIQIAEGQDENRLFALVEELLQNK